MAGWEFGEYWLTRFLLRRGLAFVYLVAFLVALRQFRPLAGEDGLLPLSEFVDATTFRERPSIFHRFPTDRAAGLAAWSGVVLASLALLGVPARLGTGVAVVVWATMWALYLSFVNAGRVFYGFGWESMLLESGFLALFLGGAGVAPPDVVIWLFRWLLFRNMFGAGLIKWRGDECWRDLTCLQYHYETQPMPNPLSWYVHHLPDRFHRLGVGANHVVELGVPFLFFAPQPVASVAGAVTIGFQGWLMLSGNFSWLNLLTIVQATSTFADPQLAAVLPVTEPAGAPTPLPLLAAAVAFAAYVAWRSREPVRNLLSSNQAMNRSYDPLHLVGTYGAFGSITRRRYELIVQGTTDPDPGPDSDWRDYSIPGLPGDPAERPPQVAPYHHRLGWQSWFAAMRRSPAGSPWVVHLCAKLLSADTGTLSLFHDDPFDGERPTAVRILRYRYRFTTPAERRETGDWWRRDRVGVYYGPVSVDDPRFRRLLERRGWMLPKRPAPGSG